MREGPLSSDKIKTHTLDLDPDSHSLRHTLSCAGHHKVAELDSVRPPAAKFYECKFIGYRYLSWAYISIHCPPFSSLFSIMVNSLLSVYMKASYRTKRRMDLKSHH